jgi:dynamin 1-like protein
MKVPSLSQTSDWGRREVEVIKTLIRSYFDLVRKTFVDLVPKTVMHFLVNGFRENLQNELVAKLYR